MFTNAISKTGSTESSPERRTAGTFRIVLAMLWIAANLHASAVSFTQTSGYTYNLGVAVTFDTGQLPGPSSSSVGPAVDGVGLLFESSFSSGSSDFGTLKAFSHAYSASQYAFPQTQATSEFEDTIHVFSPGAYSPMALRPTSSFPSSSLTRLPS